MIKYVALLRAINVGGRVVKMEELKKMFAMPGYTNITTYIQSGNVLFNHTSFDKEGIIKEIEDKLDSSLNYEVKVLLRSMPEIAAVIENNPFKDHHEEMGLHVVFLSQPPGNEKVIAINSLQTVNEQFLVRGSELYLLCRKGGYSDSIFTNKFIEKKLGVYATTRNWNTVNKVLKFTLQ